MKEKRNLLYFFLSAFFISNALLAEFIGVKIFSLESTFGFHPVQWQIFGIELSFNLTAGVLLWPLVFIFTDVINEYYGRRGVRFLSFTAAGLITYAYGMVFLAMGLSPADWWITANADKGLPDQSIAFNVIFGQGMWIIVGSLIAFLVSQLIDVTVFHKIKSITGSKKIWLRATGSTVVSQLIDSFVVLFIAFYIGAGYDLKWVIAVMIMNYIYKFSVAVLVTPLLYLIHAGIDKYLGHELAQQMMQEAREE